ncbi:MAG TPA: phosphatidylglycerol lysyltransferase domain-containing protein [Candidatus Limnocylindrales bacterium]
MTVVTTLVQRAERLGGRSIRRLVRSGADGHRRLPASHGGRNPLPAVILLAAALLAIVAAVIVGAAATIVQVLPVDVGASDPLLAATTSLGLFALGVGLWRRKRLAWWLALVVFSSALIAQVALLGHPIAAVIAAACLVALALDRRHYRVESATVSRRLLLPLVVLASAGIALETALALAGGVALDGGGAPAGSGGIGGAADWLAFGDPAGALGLVGHGALIVAVIAVARLPLVLAAFGILRPVESPPPDPALRARALDIGRRFGRGALLPFQLGADKRVFSPPDLDGLVVYGRAGRLAVVLGDPIGPQDSAWATFDRFVSVASLRDEVPAVYQASAGGSEHLAARGLRTFRIGHEAIVDLAGFSLAGSRRANLRHTVTRAKKGGVTVRWFAEGIDPSAEVALVHGLRAIDATWRRGAGPEMGFTIGAFDPDELPSLAVSVAVDADGAPIAFTTFRPTGNDGGYVLDLMRRLPGGVPGALEWCLAEAATRMGEAGIPSLSLGLAPLAGLEVSGATVEERTLATAARLVRRSYDVRGLEFFKAKFDPHWEPRYVAVRHRRDLLGLTIALLRLHLGGFGKAIASTVRLPRAQEARPGGWAGQPGGRPGGPGQPDRDQ